MDTKSLWRSEQPLVLASKSATRLSLLVHAGLPVETIATDVDERSLQIAVENIGLSVGLRHHALFRAANEI